MKKSSFRKKLLFGKKILPARLKKNLAVSELVKKYFQAYNSARLEEACRIFTEKMLDSKRDVTIGLTLAGAITPAGLSGVIVSAMQAGFVDFIISTGANLYHDIHSALNFFLKRGLFNIDDTLLFKHDIVRI